MLSVWKSQIWKSFYLTIGGSASRDAMPQQLFSHHVFNVMEPTPGEGGGGWGGGVRSPQRPGAAAGSAGCASRKAAGQRYLLRGSVPLGLLPGRGTIWDTWGRDDQSASEPEPLIFPNIPACFCVHDVRRAATLRSACPAAELGRRGPQNTARRGAYARLLPPRVVPVCPTRPWGAAYRRVGLSARPTRCTRGASVCARPTEGSRSHPKLAIGYHSKPNQIVLSKLK